MDESRVKELEKIAAEVKKDIVRMVGVARSGPIEEPLKLAELLVYLYWEELLIVPSDPKRVDRDRFLLGYDKAVPALYAILSRRGFFDREDLWHYRRLGSVLQGLPDHRRIPGVDAPCIIYGGEFGAASALSLLLDNGVASPRVFCLLHEGVCNRQSFMLEAAAVAERVRGKPVLLVVMSCFNKDRKTDAVSEPACFLKEVGWSVFFANGQDFQDMERAIGGFQVSAMMPKAVFIHMDRERELSAIDEVTIKEAKHISMDKINRALEELERKTHG